jgi:glycosyltransferase involved in cell wall biosynthesis
MNGPVLLAGAYDDGPGYPRARSLQQGLQAAGCEVLACRRPGRGVGKQALLRAPWRWPLAYWQQRTATAQLVAAVRELVTQRRPRAIVVPYPGHAVVPAIRAATDVPLVLDLFLSAYDTVVEDRELVRPGSLGAAWLQRLDRAAVAAADLVLLDTAPNAAYVAALTGAPAERFAWLPVHDPDALAAPPPLPPLGGPLRLLFFGTGVPLHGLPVLLDAVAQAPNVLLTLVGGTPRERTFARSALGGRLQLEPSFVPTARLHELLAQNHLVAGVFADRSKARRVVPFKLVHALAAGRPVLTADTPAVAGWLDGSGAVFTTPAGCASSLAATLQELAAEPAAIAAAAAVARDTYERHFGTAAQAARWRQILARLPTTTTTTAATTATAVVA